MKPTAPLTTRMAFWGIVFASILPVILGIFLFEEFLVLSQIAAREKAAEIFPAAARLMEESAQPANALTWGFCKAFGENPAQNITRENVSEIVEKGKQRLGFPANIYCFGEMGKMIFPADCPDKADRETLMGAAEILRKKRQLTWEQQQDLLAGRKACQRLFGHSHVYEIYFSSRFSWESLIPSEPPRFTAFFFAPQIAGGVFPNCLQVGIFRKDIPQSLLNDASLLNKPEDVPYAAILPPGQSLPEAQRGLPWFSPDRLTNRDHFETVETIPEGFLWKQPLSEGSDRTLVLALPFPFPANISPQTRLGFEVFLLITVAFGGAHLAAFILGKRRISLSLGWQIGFSFFFAGLIPLLALVFLGISRWQGVDELSQTRWKNLMQNTLAQTDQRFCNWLESTQEVGQKFSRELAQADLKTFPAQQIPSRLESSAVIFFANSREETFTPLTSAVATTTEAGATPLDTQIRRVSMECFRQILTERGQRMVANEKGEKALSFSAKDILGDTNPIFSLLKGLGRIGYLDFNTTQYLTFCDLVETVEERILGFALFIKDIQIETKLFLDREVKHLRASHSPLRLVPVNPTYGTNQLDFNLPNLALSVSQTMKTQTSQAFPFTTKTGEEFFVTTFLSPHYRGLLPIMAVPMEKVTSEKGALIGNILLFVFLVLAIMILISHRLWKKIISPLRALQAGAKNIAMGKLDHRLPLLSEDELGRLSQAFNEMAQGLQERERLRRFVSQSAQESARSSLEALPVNEMGQQIEVAILFSDIRSFTTLSESEPPDEVVNMLNEYFTLMDSAIRLSKGEIQKFIGDAIMAVFHGHPSQPHPALRAVQAGLEMRNRLLDFNLRRRQRGVFEIEHGIGIHFGQVVEGKVGADDGRLDFTVMGLSVNRAQSLESMSKFGTSSKILVSLEVKTLIEECFSFSALPTADGTAFEVRIPKGQPQ